MDIKTGQIVHIKSGEPVPKHVVPLERLPLPTCPLCKGKGHSGTPTKIGRGKQARWEYKPCPCTQ